MSNSSGSKTPRGSQVKRNEIHPSSVIPVCLRLNCHLFNGMQRPKHPRRWRRCTYYERAGVSRVAMQLSFLPVKSHLVRILLQEHWSIQYTPPLTFLSFASSSLSFILQILTAYFTHYSLPAMQNHKWNPQEQDGLLTASSRSTCIHPNLRTWQRNLTTKMARMTSHHPGIHGGGASQGSHEFNL